MQGDDAEPSLARGLYRLAVLFVCVACISGVCWELFSKAAAFSRLSAAVAIFPYQQRCDADGHPIDTGPPNCVDLGRYVVINGPVIRAFRRACGGSKEPAAMLVLEESKASTSDIVSVEKALHYQLDYPDKVPC